MNKLVSINIIRFVVLLLVQVLILKGLELHGFIHFSIYPLFILLLPIDIPRWLELLLAFVMGLLVDIFYNTIGFHSAALVFMAFLRPSIINFNKPPGGYEEGELPLIENMGLRWSIIYLGIGILLHNFVLYTIEAGNFIYIYQSILKILLSGLASLALMLLYQFLLKPKQ